MSLDTFTFPPTTGSALRRDTARAAAAPWRWAVTGGLMGLIAMLLVQAPAQWLALALAWTTHDQVLLQQARGTLWQGSAQMVLTGGAGSRDAQALPGRMAWTLHPLSTTPHATVQADCCMATPLHMRLAVAASGAELQLSDTPSTWPAALLSGLGAPWNTLQPEGDLVFAPQGLKLLWRARQWQTQGQLTVTARDMASRLTPLKPMGSYRLDMTAGDTPSNGANLQLSTLSGKLILSGQGLWTGRHLQFQGEASAAPDHEAALNNLLSIIGRRQGARSLLSWG